MKQRSVDIIFWENVKRFITEKGVTVTKAEKACEVAGGYFKQAEIKQGIPTRRLLMNMAEYFNKEYIEFFEDWGE